MIRTLKSLLVLAAAICGVAGAGTTAHAGSQTSTITVTATVATTCSISASALAFGTYDTVSATPLDQSATLTVNCTNGGTGAIELSQGNNPAAGSSDTIPLRQMASGANRLAYFLYTNIARTTVWGAGAAAVTYSGTGAATSVTVYGRIPAGQPVQAGAYTDLVTATINF